mmetsp:Transcript_37648/g.89434  ORF Transcript_37648/g.89434 Transcript_37648/m.89434 type:complete len:704 (-) Transcript_37648:227-2338(-)
MVSLSAGPLEKLARADLLGLLARTSSGERGLVSLYKECKAGGLLVGMSVAEYEMDDIKRLQTLFSIALDHGLACFVVDYVNEVCHNEYAASSDAYEAHLMDAEMVRGWCGAVLLEAQAEVCEDGPAVRRGEGHRSLAPVAPMWKAGTLQRQLSRASGLVLVLRALSARPGQPGPGDPEEAEPRDPTLQAALRLRQCLSVALWCAERGLCLSPPTGGHGSRPAWMKKCSDRAAAMEAKTGLGLFIADALEAVAEGGEAGSQLLASYPPKSVEQAIGGLFLQHGTRRAAWQAKLAALLYYVEDLGHRGDSAADPCASFRQSFGLHPSQISRWRAAFLLDKMIAESAPEGIADVCSLLRGAASRSMPFKFAQVLSRGFGEHAAALELLRSGAGEGTAGELSQAVAAAEIRLSCGLLSEAFLEIRRHCRSLREPRRQSHTRVLINGLLSWAAQNKALGKVLLLPLEHEEEAVLHEWLGGDGRRAGAPPQLLPLYYIQRGRTPDALLCGSEAVRPTGRGALTEACSTVVSQARQALPVVQQQLCAYKAATAAAAAAAPAGGPVLRCLQPTGRAEAESILQQSRGGQLLLSPLLSGPRAADGGGAMDVDGGEPTASSPQAAFGAFLQEAGKGARAPGSASEPHRADRLIEGPRVLFGGGGSPMAGDSPRSERRPAASSRQEFMDLLAGPKPQKGRQPAKRARLAWRASP